MRLLVVATITLGASTAFALPQFSVRSVRQCDTCHVAPEGWEDPAVDLRKCSLNCNVCHVAPTGGGLRNESGIFYGRQTLPMFGPRPADAAYKPVELVPHSQQPGSQPASRPAAPPAEPAKKEVPEPGTAGRYAGIEPHPTFQIGGDIRGMMPYYSAQELPDADGNPENDFFFPMQFDLHLAARPYNPVELNEGRLTLVLTAGFEGDRAKGAEGVVDRLFVKEWYAMYHDLPNQMYARLGRFLPPHGWRLDDHTVFTRQSLPFIGGGLDGERQVTGVEVGINPNYFYGHLAVYSANEEWEDQFEFEDGGFGTTLSAGWRDLGWQAGSSITYGRREGLSSDGDTGNQMIYSLQWAYNFYGAGDGEWAPDIAPLIYLGEYSINHQPDRELNEIGLAAFHEINWLIVQGLNSKLRYSWIDPDTKVEFDTNHRLAVGLEFYPIMFTEVIVQYRHNWSNTDDRFEGDSDEFFVQLHGWY